MTKPAKPVAENPKKARRTPAAGIAKGAVKLHQGKGK